MRFSPGLPRERQPGRRNNGGLGELCFHEPITKDSAHRAGASADSALRALRLHARQPAVRHSGCLIRHTIVCGEPEPVNLSLKRENPRFLAKARVLWMPPVGVEPTTTHLRGGCSNQLSYGGERDYYSTSLCGISRGAAKNFTQGTRHPAAYRGAAMTKGEQQ